MELAALQAIARDFNDANVRYIIVGGMAVVAHGYGRMTFDVDFVIKLERQNILQAFAALAKAGYRPRVPVTAEQFADASLREEWIKEKGMMVLNLWSEIYRDTAVDIFVTEPFDFDRAESTSLCEFLEDGTPVRFADIPTLIQMKKNTGREKDADDISHLEMLSDEN